MTPRTPAQRGQVLVMTTLALFAMFGMLGLAMDLGWSYFTRKSAQSAADSAALAAAQQALEQMGQRMIFVCGEDLTCQASLPCPTPVASPPATNIDNGCLYAERNGFAHLGRSGRQRVEIAADTTSPPPTAPGVRVYYWATARTSEAVPQLFSAVLGNTVAHPSARATAGIVDAPVAGSVILLNRANDVTPVGRGVDLIAGGGATLIGGSGIFMASDARGEGNNYAGEIGGTSTVQAPFTYIRGKGEVSDKHGLWNEEPRNGFRDGDYFRDPMRGKGQPPPPAGLSDCPVLNGVINGTNGLVGPGNYYAVDTDGNATGAKIRFTSKVDFTTAGSCFNNNAATGGFGNYVFFGGMDLPNTQTKVTFTPGRYVLAGVKGGNPGSVFSFTNQVEITDRTPVVNGEAAPNNDAGQIFIFTDANYPGLEVPAKVQPIKADLKLGMADLQAGNNSSTLINLHGLNANPDSAGYYLVPPELHNFRPVVFWQDQRNSSVKYTPDGNIDVTSCGVGLDGSTAPTLDNPCANTELVNSASPRMNLQATMSSHYFGSIYQPRGGWLRFQGSSGLHAPLQLITGAVDLQGGPMINLKPIGTPLTRKIVALVE